MEAKPMIAHLIRRVRNGLVTRCLSGLLVLAVVGCCTDPVTGGKYFCLFEISDAEEVRLGDEYAPNFIAQSGGRYPDPELQQALSQIVVDRMAKKSQRPDLPWTFEVLNTSQINAFALPGGRVFVTRGLLSQLESEAQFAHLMGHEIGHVTHRHSVRGQTRAAAFQLFLGLIAATEQTVREEDDEGPLWVSTAAGLGGQLLTLKYSRDQELQSDARGVDYSLEAGYDPREAVKTFELFLRLKEGSGSTESFIDGLLSTHPLDKKRIESIELYLAENHPNLESRSDLVVSSPGWSSLLGRVRQAQAVYRRYDQAMAAVAEARSAGGEAGLDAAEREIRACLQALPNHAPFHAALGIIGIQRNDDAGAERALDRASDLDPRLFDARLNRGFVRARRGQHDAAMTDLEAAHRLYPYSPIPCYYLGISAEALGNRGKAVEWYQSTLQRAEETSDVAVRARKRLEELGGE